MRVVPLAAALVALAPSALAQQPMGRIAFFDPQSAAPQGEAGWTEAGGNAAVAAGRSYRTGAKSRAEIRLVEGALDLAPATRLDIIVLNPGNAEFALHQGRMRLDLRALDPGRTIAVDLPRGDLRIRQPGEYDIDAGTLRQPSRIAVLSGLAHFAGSAVDTDIKTDETVVLTGVNPVIARFERAAPDAFDAWARARQSEPAPAYGSGEPPAAKPPAVAPVARAPAEALHHVERRPEHGRVRHVYRYRQRQRYYADRTFNPLRPLFSLFRW